MPTEPNRTELKAEAKFERHTLDYVIEGGLGNHHRFGIVLRQGHFKS